MKSHFSLIPQATRWAVINAYVCHLDGPCWKLQNELREISAQNGIMSGSTYTEKKQQLLGDKSDMFASLISYLWYSNKLVRQSSLRIRGLQVHESLQWGVKINLLSKLIS